MTSDPNDLTELLGGARIKEVTIELTRTDEAGKVLEDFGVIATTSPEGS